MFKTPLPTDDPPPPDTVPAYAYAGVPAMHPSAPQPTGADPYSDLTMEINIATVERAAARLRTHACLPRPVARRAPAALRALLVAPPRRPSSPPAFLTVQSGRPSTVYFGRRSRRFICLQ